LRTAGRLPVVRRLMAGDRPFLTFADRLVLYALVGAALVLFITGGGQGDGATVRITGDGGFEYLAPLDSDTIVEVEGPLGATVVGVSDGEAGVLSSPCPHELCVKMGAVRAPGRAVVCVPNRVVVTVVGDGPTPTDAVTR